MSALGDVLRTIARAVGTPDAMPVRIGDIVLTPQQSAAVDLVRQALAEFGGALLADVPGAGKTYVALAVAAPYGRCVVAAPAALRSTWRTAAGCAAVEVQFVSLEALSRGRLPPPAPIVIVDEAHRVSNPRARRYAHVAALAHRGHLLLVTATPVRNRRAERDALLGLFLGPQAASIDDATLTRCIVRRERAPGGTAPRIVPHEPVRWRCDPRVVAMLRALPPPVALADGSPASGLVATGLARSLTSSVAALDQALVRRLQRGAAIAASLDAGRLPTHDELRAWVLGDDAMQLALPFVSSPATGHTIVASRALLERHVAATGDLRAIVAPRVRADAARRAARLLGIARRHPGATVIAFTCFEATARAIFSALRTTPGVVLLTGERAESGAGPITRDDVLAAVGPQRVATPTMQIGLVIATDLLSEGVNLQGASVVVHLDDPWTPSALQQRVGRAARMGSTHEAVHVYRFHPPRYVNELVALDTRHAAKRAAAAHALAPGDVAERLRRIAAQLLGRLHDEERIASRPRAVAACDASVEGFVAVLRDDARAWTVAGTPRPSGGWTISDDPWSVHRLLAAVDMEERAAPGKRELYMITAAVRRWTARRMARGSAGLDRAPSIVARRLLGRLGRVVAAAGAAARPNVAARAGRVRALIAASRGVAIEIRMTALLGRDPLAPGWLDTVERAFEGQSDAARTCGGTEVVAVLYLRRRGRLLTASKPPNVFPVDPPTPAWAAAIAPPAPAPCRRAASPGTAAIR